MRSFKAWALSWSPVNDFLPLAAFASARGCGLTERHGHCHHRAGARPVARAGNPAHGKLYPQQYVITARAKGVSETALTFKYPVRVALNPIISTVG